MSTAGTEVRPMVLDDWAFLPRPQEPGTHRLVCFPHAGGDISAFARLAAALEPGIEVLAVRLPGRGGRFAQPMPSSFPALRAAVIAGIGHRMVAGSTFYGQSFGALLAYEVARALSEDRRPAALIAASAPAPAVWTRTNGRAAADPDAEAERLLALGDAGLDADDTLRELALETLRADLVVSTDYRHDSGPLPSFAVHAVAGAWDGGAADALAGWAAATRGTATTTVVPAGHLLVSTASAGPPELIHLIRSTSQGAHRVHSDHH